MTTRMKNNPNENTRWALKKLFFSVSSLIESPKVVIKYWNQEPKKIMEIERKCTLMTLINRPLSDRQAEKSDDNKNEE